MSTAALWRFETEHIEIRIKCRRPEFLSHFLAEILALSSEFYATNR